MQPLEIKRKDTQGLEIKWSHDFCCFLPSRTLRLKCPCATCKESRGEGSHEKPIQKRAKGSALRIVESTAAEQLALKKIWAVGNYAIGIEWEDHHNTGIYTFDFLYRLCQDSKE